MDVLEGIIVLLLCSGIYVVAFLKHRKSDDAAALALIVLSGLVLRIYSASDPYLHEWDERYHALVAKHLMHHLLRPTLYETALLPYDPNNWTINTIWLHKQPFALWLMALSLKVFGVQVWAVRVPSIIVSTIGIKLTYDIAKSLYNTNVAMLAAFLFSIQGSVIELASGRTATDHVDIAFLFFILLAVWSCVRYVKSSSFFYILLAGVGLGAALLTKWLPALIVLPIALYAMYIIKGDGVKKTAINTAIIMLIAGVIFLPWQLYILGHYPAEARWEYLYNSRHFFVAVEGHYGYRSYYIDRIRTDYGALIYLPIILFTYLVLTRKNKSDMLIAIWFFIPCLFFSLAATKMPSYIIIAAPAVLIITSIAFLEIVQYAQENKTYRWFLQLICFLLIALPAIYTIDRIKPLEGHLSPGWNNKILAIKASGYNDSTCVFMNCGHPVELMFATSCVAYENQANAMIAGKKVIDFNKLDTLNLSNITHIPN